MNIACEVLVIGGGPTGLMAALLMHRAGVDVRVVDPRLQPSTESRALVMLARSIELFASLGLSEKLFARGALTTDVEFFVSGKKLGGLHFDKAHAPDTPFQFSLAIPQADTEAVLIEALSEAGLKVDRGIEVTGLHQDDEQVTVGGNQPSGEAITLRAHYVIGADGAHSVVRKTLALKFDGSEYAQDFLLGDVEVDWLLDRTGFRGFMHGDRLGLFMPLSGTGTSRVMATNLTPNGNVDQTTGELTLGELQDAFEKAACLPVTLRNPRWLTHFRSHHRCVDRFRVGRVFVAGDAAHIHSPAGGQGMNTGLQDAANLAWKLALAVKGTANDELLDSYEGERLPVARSVVHLTDSLFSAAAGQSGWTARLRDALAPLVIGPAASLDVVQGKAFRTFSQIDIDYPASIAVIRQAGHRQAGTARPGLRAPNAQLSRHRDLFDLLQGFRFHVLVLSLVRLDEQGLKALQALAGTLKTEMCDVHLIVRLTFAPHDSIERVERTEVFERYEVTGQVNQAIVLVRPDGYVGWRGEGLDMDGCRNYLQRCGVLPLAETSARAVL